MNFMRKGLMINFEPKIAQAIANGEACQLGNGDEYKVVLVSEEPITIPEVLLVLEGDQLYEDELGYTYKGRGKVLAECLILNSTADIFDKYTIVFKLLGKYNQPKSISTYYFENTVEMFDAAYYMESYPWKTDVPCDYCQNSDKECSECNEHLFQLAYQLYLETSKLSTIPTNWQLVCEE